MLQQKLREKSQKELIIIIVVVVVVVVIIIIIIIIIIQTYETRHSNGRTMSNIWYNSKIRDKICQSKFYVILLYIFNAACFGLSTQSYHQTKLEYQIKFIP